MKLFKVIFNCHQIPERSFFIAGRQLPLCARCTGILTGFIMSPIPIFLNFRIPMFLSFAFIPCMIADGTIQLLFCIMSNNIRRFVTGILFSAGIVNIAAYIIL